jgi:hypothetical protein
MKKLIPLLVIIALGLSLLNGDIRYKIFGPAALSLSSNEPGARYKSDLLAAIRAADQIVVTEHSDRAEYSAIHGNINDYKELTYQVVKVDASAKQKFLGFVSEMDEKTQDAFPACIAEPHHRIDFYTQGKLQSKMEICFTCGQIEWAGASNAPPWAIYSTMEKFITSLGLHPKLDWTARMEGTQSRTENRDASPVVPMSASKP